MQLLITSEKCELTDTHFKIMIIFQKLKFFHWQPIFSSCFPLSDRLILLIFQKMSAKCPNLNNHGLFRIYSVKQKICSRKKGIFS